MLALWYRFEEMFGRMFVENYCKKSAGDDFGALPFWHQELNQARLTPDDLGRGIRRCIDVGLQYPPSLGRFIQLSRPCQQMTYHRHFLPDNTERPSSEYLTRNLKQVIETAKS